MKERVKKTDFKQNKNQLDSQKKRRKGREKKVDVLLNWQKNASPHLKKQYNLSARVNHPFPNNHIPFDVFSVTMNLDPLLKLLVDQKSLYAQQNGRDFKTNIGEIKASLRINYYMIINKFPTIKSYCEYAQYVSNQQIRNVISRTRFEQMSQNLKQKHFTDNQNHVKIDKAYRARSVISHFNYSFLACVYNNSTQSVNEHVVKFKGGSTMRINQ